ncbi:hypothetical protein BD309DRAFT_844860, partial [Dichomitus squalens]
AAKPKFPNIEWSANDSYLLWQVISEAEKEENRKVLFGKKLDQVCNSSPANKAAVHKRIAAAVIPTLFALDGATAGDRVKGRIAALITTYRSYACNVTSTGRGVQKNHILEGQDSPEDISEDGTTAGWIASVPWDGPDHDTPERARNIWEQVEQEWPFFPRLHRL